MTRQKSILFPYDRNLKGRKTMNSAIPISYKKPTTEE